MKEKLFKSQGFKVFLILFLTLSLTVSALSGLLFGLQAFNHSTVSKNNTSLLEEAFLREYCRKAQSTLQLRLFPVRGISESIDKQFSGYNFGNLRVALENESGETVYSNFKEEEATLQAEANSYSDSKTFWLSELNSLLANNTLDTSLLSKGSKEALANLEQYNGNENISLYFTYTLKLALAENLTAQDAPFYIHRFFETLETHTLAVKLTFFISTVLSVALLVLLIQSAGKKEGVAGVYLPRRHRFPGDLLLLLSLAGLIVIFALLFLLTDFFGPHFLLYGGVLDFAVRLSIFLLFFGFCLSSLIFVLTVYCLTVQTKAHAFLRLTCLAKLHRGNKRLLKFLKDLPSLWQVGIVVLVFLVGIGVCLSFSSSNIWSFWAFAWALGLALYVLLLYRSFRKIMKETKAIAAGDLQKKVSEQHLYGDFKRHADAINHIGDSMEHAVEERMKSERFKTELITNVSHDIKTPLTSIVSYVDLLEKEHLQNENAKEYIAVLSRQSARLKKLIEDLMEASKASAGTLPVHNESINLDILSSQILGEYEERFAEKQLDFRLQKSRDNITVLADSRHLWRVLDNLFSNVFKYAMPTSRVYFDLSEQDGKAQILLRNMSKEPLHISAADLTERFVRGDASRNTEGSGLGLSIAKSLTELQGGSFDIQIDGDLFKVQLTFPLA